MGGGAQDLARGEATEEDAAPRITTRATSGGKSRIDVADTAVVRPGNPDKQNG